MTGPFEDQSSDRGQCFHPTWGIGLDDTRLLAYHLTYINT
jgi:hypothetical protein